MKRFVEKIDTRKLSQEALQQLRYQAIRLRKKEMTYQAISEIIDVHLFPSYSYRKVERMRNLSRKPLKIIIVFGLLWLPKNAGFSRSFFKRHDNHYMD